MTPVEITLPVYARVGDEPEAHFGDVTIRLTDGTLTGAADEIEPPTASDEGAPDAAAHR